ncbi:MAG TPA: hypothetical protein VFU49_20225, partial [Ktedonobacteraceae bacterium]|nr:hypothetical protein [Ktedonobacteraceae bacterium]
GTYIGSKLTPRVYQSTVLVHVKIPSGDNQIDSNSLLASGQLAQTEADLAVSDDILNKVVAHHKNITLDQLSHEATSSVKLNTQLFEIDVQDADAKRAADLANDVAQTLINSQLEETQQNNDKSIQQIQQEMNSIRQQIKDVTGQVAALQAKGGQLAADNILQGQLSVLQQHYNQWEDSLTQLELTSAQSSDFLQIVQVARPETTAIRPNVSLNTLAGLILGLILGVLLAIQYDTFSTRVYSPKSVAEHIGYPLLATIWRANSYQEANSVNPLSKHSNVNAYRMLCASVEVAGPDKRSHSIMVTSALSQEGKSAIATNLAIFMANAGKNTLLVDANLQHPVLHERFGIADKKEGLSNALAAISQRPFANSLSLNGQVQPLPAKNSTMSLEPYIHPVGIANLRVMTAGTGVSSPGALLDLKVVERLLAIIEGSGAEVVIFDTAPLLDMPDARVLATKVDTALVVVDVTSARKRYLEQMKILAENIRIPVLGCVVNKQLYAQKHVTDYYYTNNLRHPSQPGNEVAVPVSSPSILSSDRQRMYSDIV